MLRTYCVSTHIGFLFFFNIQNNLCTQHALRGHVLSLQFSSTELVHNSMNNLLSYCGLVDARISVSEKDLPVVEFVSCMQRGGGVSFHNRN